MSRAGASPQVSACVAIASFKIVFQVGEARIVRRFHNRLGVGKIAQNAIVTAPSPIPTITLLADCVPLLHRTNYLICLIYAGAWTGTASVLDMYDIVA